jgi:hypothetical protein
VRWQLRRRDLLLNGKTLELLGADASVGVVNPLVDPRFVAAVADVGGRRGFARRRDAVAALLGEIAPTAALARPDKARFGEVFWRSPSRTLAREWRGEAVDGSLVHPARLQAIWHGSSVELRTAHLLQQVWLVTNRPRDSSTCLDLCPTGAQSSQRLHSPRL